MKRAAFFDRDGTLNHLVWRNGKFSPPFFKAELEIVPIAYKVISELRDLDFIPVIFTNQPDIARNKVTLESVNIINREISTILGIKNIYTCIHDDADNCSCRKPLPGMLLSAANDLNIELSESIVIGDSWRDVEAGQAVDCRCFLIENPQNIRLPNHPFEMIKSLGDVLSRLETKII